MILFLAVIILSPFVHIYAVDYTPVGLLSTIYSDGVVDINYDVDVAPTLARVSFTLFGASYHDLIVTNTNGLPITYTLQGSMISVDSLGSTGVSISYNTPDLTSKMGSLWSFNVTVACTIGVLLPESATVMSISSVPLQVSTMNNRPYLALPAGVNEVNYILGPVGSKDRSLAQIKDAETAIANAKASGVIVTAAEYTLNQAKVALTIGDFVNAEQLASQARVLVSTAEADAAAADNVIKRTSDAVNKARAEGRTSGLSKAEASLSEAQNLYKIGSYSQATIIANRANDEAEAAKVELNYFLIGAAFIVVVIFFTGVYYFARHKRRPEPTAHIPTFIDETTEVDLEAIFKKNLGMRVDDKEVLRFLTERDGTAFANEIRDRFDIPRTSAWRMIRRLIDNGIVEERKIGGQSLIAITNKYRRKKEG